MLVRSKVAPFKPKKVGKKKTPETGMGGGSKKVKPQKKQITARQLSHSEVLSRNASTKQDRRAQTDGG